jgi:predicted ATPase
MGCAEAELGKVNDGIEQMKRGLELHDSMASKLRLPYFLGLLAEQLSKGGRAEEGLATVSKAICVSDLTGERYLLSELYRIKGELLIQSAERSTVTSHRTDIATLIDRSSAPTNAESCFAEALAIARQQGAKFLEMKIASSMNRLNN